MIHSYPWYIADWRDSETRLNLTLEERALYRELLDFCYLERSLPVDERKLARIANCSDAEFTRCWTQVKPLFNELNGRYFHPKVTEVLGKLDGYKEQKRLAGIASGERRRNGRSTPVAFSLPKNATENEPTNRTNPSATTSATSTTSSTTTPTPTTTADFPETAIAVRSYFPSADNAIVISIAHAAVRSYADAVNGHGKAPTMTDAIIAEAVREAYFRKQQSPGLFLEKVPRVVKSWAEEAIRNGTIH